MFFFHTVVYFFIQAEVEKLSPLQSQLDDALIQVKSLEAMRGRLERHQKEAEDTTESNRTYYESVIQRLKTEHNEELSEMKLLYENHEKVMFTCCVW